MLVRFWGVCASQPSAGGNAAGRNTPCVEVRDETSGDILILDAGTGIVGLASALPPAPATVSILLSDGRAEHTEGLPAVLTSLPAARRTMPVTVCAPSRRHDLQDGLASGAYPAPVTLVEPGELRIGGFEIRAQAAGGLHDTLAYRIRGSSSDLVYISALDCDAEYIGEVLAPFAFNSGATILGADWQHATEFASATGAGRLWLLQRGARHTVNALDDMESRARHAYPATKLAREGDEFHL
jgi:hypothetical protein